MIGRERGEGEVERDRDTSREITEREIKEREVLIQYNPTGYIT